MDEKETQKEKPTTDDTGKGNEPKIPKVIEQANIVAERIEEANRKQEELINRQEELAANQTMAGTAEAGIKPIEKKELTPKEYAEAMERGEVDPMKEDGF